MTNDPLYIEVPSPSYLNQSRWKAYQDCDRYYGWTYLEGLEPLRKRHYFEFGTAIHKAQVIVHSQGGTDDAVKEGVAAAEKSFRDGMVQPIQLPGDEAELQDGVDLINKLLPAYYAYYGKERLWKPLGMELSFCVEVGEGSNVFLVGRIDNLVTFQGSLWLVDYKTMGKLDMRTFMQYELDIQLTAYIYGGTKQLSIEAKKSGRPPVVIRGAIIDGIVKTKVPQFHRELYTRTINDLREFEQEFVEKAREISAKHKRVKPCCPHHEDLHEDPTFLGKDAPRKCCAAGCNCQKYIAGEPWKVVFPKNTQHCHRYGTCVFKDLCVADTETRRLSYGKREPDYVDLTRVKNLQGV